MKKLVVFSGAGISAESGLKTFRDSDGLWENYRIEDVATPEAWIRNQELVLDFYNQRRLQVMMAVPNKAHLAIASLQNQFDVHVITQNIDDLHERAGSRNVLHLHGEIMKARSTADSSLLYEVRSGIIKKGDLCVLGSQLRPHVVWFGEIVHELSRAALVVEQAEIFIVVGTSLQVYPAAGLVAHCPPKAQKYCVDPQAPEVRGFEIIHQTAAAGLPVLSEKLLASSGSENK
ncbi:MAG: NAD-dependent deacylase [Bacteroidetes bacterium]|nr:MAG: NAD-dependent deacylase [Bacteroidota bacterium]REJ99874.1 MAG: NAD-dependent deacylase [Bacteroidota bacterium]REK34247.1 MAG: NAD-dependent deacylase [Bacteroidota bacterium]REK50577.1 MAG: NAD-dependent deacylase [Bacteroidota bacterium]